MQTQNLTQAELNELDKIFSQAIDKTFEQVVLSAAVQDGDTVGNLNEWSQQNGAEIKATFGIETIEDTNKFMHDQLMAAAKRIADR